MNQDFNSRQIRQYSNIQPVWKFVFLYMITSGIYQIPWGHKHWKFIKQREGLKINAWLRSCLLPFTLFWLAKRIFALAEEKGYSEKPSPAAISSLFWFFVFLAYKLDLIIFSFSFFALLTVLKAANFYWEKEQPNLPLRKSWTGGEIAWAVSGIIFWLLVLIGLFIVSDTPSKG
jgi:hypothetical protein